MNLENKIALYCKLGKTDYNGVYNLQQKLANSISNNSNLKDIILFTEHYPIVNFGMRYKHNDFSKELYNLLKQKNIEPNKENAILYLEKHGINFSHSSRGGGATYIGPGQLNVYPIVRYEKITNTLLGVDKYKNLIDDIMLNVLLSYNIDVKNINVAKELNEGNDSRDRKDIWLEKDGKNFKLGGKGIRITKDIAYHGFNFYLSENSIDGFKYVNPCGYSLNELGVISLEETLSKKIDINEFQSRVLDEIKEKFNFDSIKEISVNKLYTLYELDDRLR